jgi:hypothetical protein
MYQGTPVIDGEVGAWTAIGAEKTATGYEMAWKGGSADQYTVWNTDANGNYLNSAFGVVAGSDMRLELLEASFQQDLNGDGKVGPSTFAQSSTLSPAGDAGTAGDAVLVVHGLASVQTMADFDAAHDTVQLDHAIFSNLPVGQLDASHFALGVASADVAQIVYEPLTGALSYDLDGRGPAAGTQFAVLANHPGNLSATNFLVS